MGRDITATLGHPIQASFQIQGLFWWCVMLSSIEFPLYRIEWHACKRIIVCLWVWHFFPLYPTLHHHLNGWVPRAINCQGRQTSAGWLAVLFPRRRTACATCVEKSRQRSTAWMFFGWNVLTVRFFPGMARGSWEQTISDIVFTVLMKSKMSQCQQCH